MKRSILTKVFVAAAASLLVILPASAKKPAAKYVFYLIGDGMGINEVYGADIYSRNNGGEGVNFLNFPVRTFVTTHSASSLVTDSAAGGTALATGVKTTNDYMGVDPQDNPLRNLTEMAHAAGYGTGVATSVGVNHATPAAFYAHTHARSSYNTIAEQLIAAENVNFAAGAGFLTESKKGIGQQYFKDKAKEAGISVLHGKAEFNNIGARKGRVFCFSGKPTDTELVYAMDRQGGETELLDFTKAGIEYLYSNFKKGFFFMIEGGKIDYAGHNDDAACNIHELIDYTKTVQCILDFYNQHPDETLIVITADHETSGYMLSSGQYALTPKYLAGQKYSENVISEKFRELTAPKAPARPGQRPSMSRVPWETVKAFLKENLGMWDVVPVSGKKEAELWTLYESGAASVESLYATNDALISACINYVDSMAGYLLPIGSHSGSPVGLYVKGAGAEQFMYKCTDNTDVPKTIAAVAGY